MGHLYARHAQSSRHAHTAHTTHSNNVRAISRRKLAHNTGASSAAHLHTTTAQPPRGMLGARGTYVYSKAHLVISRVRRAVACSLPVLVDHLFPVVVVVVVSLSLTHSPRWHQICALAHSIAVASIHALPCITRAPCARMQGRRRQRAKLGGVERRAPPHARAVVFNTPPPQSPFRA